MAAQDFDYDQGQSRPLPIYGQWHNGNSLLEQLGGLPYTGGTIIEAKYIPEDMELPGFDLISLKLNREPKQVFAQQNTQIAILARRLRYFSGKGDDRKNYTQTQYEEATAQGVKLRGNLQLAVHVKGLDKVVFLSINGTGSREILAEMKRLYKEAIPVTAKKIGEQEVTMPLHAFWLTLSPQKHSMEGGEQKSEVTHPTFNLPEKFDKPWLLERYVGGELLKQFNAEADQLKDWSHAWDSIVSGSGESEGEA